MEWDSPRTLIVDHHSEITAFPLRVVFHGCAFRAGVRAVVVICTRVTSRAPYALSFDFLDFAYYDGVLPYDFSESP